MHGRSCHGLAASRGKMLNRLQHVPSALFERGCLVQTGGGRTTHYHCLHDIFYNKTAINGVLPDFYRENFF